MAVLLAALLIGAAGYFYWKQTDSPEALQERASTGHRMLFGAIMICQYRTGSIVSDPEELVRQGFLDSVPVNPYSGKPMKNILLGGTISPGDYSFIPDTDLSAFRPTTTQECTGYFLLGHGKPGSRGDTADFDRDGIADTFPVVDDLHVYDWHASCGNTNMLMWSAQEILDCYYDDRLPDWYASWLKSDSDNSK